jgi:hypothetical protein
MSSTLAGSLVVSASLNSQYNWVFYLDTDYDLRITWSPINNLYKLL